MRSFAVCKNTTVEEAATLSSVDPKKSKKDDDDEDYEDETESDRKSRLYKNKYGNRAKTISESAALEAGAFYCRVKDRCTHNLRHYFECDMFSVGAKISNFWAYSVVGKPFGRIP